MNHESWVTQFNHFASHTIANTFVLLHTINQGNNLSLIIASNIFNQQQMEQDKLDLMLLTNSLFIVSVPWENIETKPNPYWKFLVMELFVVTVDRTNQGEWKPKMTVNVSFLPLRAPPTWKKILSQAGRNVV